MEKKPGFMPLQRGGISLHLLQDTPSSHSEFNMKYEMKGHLWASKNSVVRNEM
jgi:hypothetical protein